MIGNCNCVSAQQDALHGLNKRTHNHAPKTNSGAGGWRCTVCAKVKTHREMGIASIKEAEKKQVAAETPKKGK